MNPDIKYVNFFIRRLRGKFTFLKNSFDISKNNS